MATRKQPSKKHPKPGKKDAEGVKLKVPRRKNIPKGNRKSDQYKRLKQIKSTLKPLTNKKVYNKAIGKKVTIDHDSITETKFHGSHSYHSTIAAMDAVRQIKKTKNPKPQPVDSKTTKSRMNLCGMIELEGKKGSRKTRVMLGEEAINKGKERKKKGRGGRTLLYSITVKDEKRPSRR